MVININMVWLAVALIWKILGFLKIDVLWKVSNVVFRADKNDGY